MRDGHLFFLMGQQLAQAVAPEAATQAMRFGRLTALRKPDGGIRGIVASDVVRRLVSRTITQQFSDAALAATSPFQYALSTIAGCECISHALQSLSELDPNATILSIHGAMLQGLANLCPSALLFARQFHGSPSHYIWEADAGVVHNISQGDAVVVLFGATCGTHGGLGS